MEDFLNHFEDTVLRLSYKYSQKKSRYTQQELYQAGYVGLLKCAHIPEIMRKFKISPELVQGYVFTTVRNHIFSEKRFIRCVFGKANAYDQNPYYDSLNSFENDESLHPEVRETKPNELMESVWEAVDSLSHDKQILLREYVYCEAENRDIEIGKNFNLTREAVRKKISRIYATIRNQVKKESMT